MGDCLSSPLPCLPSAGEAHRIFEMCFDHQSSEKALIFYWPKMKGNRWKKNKKKQNFCKRLSRFTGDVLFVSFFILLKEETGIYSKDVFQSVKLWALKLFKCFVGRSEMQLVRIQENPWISVISCLPSPLPSLFKNLPFTEQIQMLDNEWVKVRDWRNVNVSISQQRAT